MFQSTKTYNHEVGLSAAFRQWRAESHCRFIHGYPLSVKLVFEAATLDSNHWVVDFGSLKPIKAVLESYFDHKLLVAHDDPELALYKQMDEAGIADVVMVTNIGCESFAQLAYTVVEDWLHETKQAPRVRLVSAEVREHGANSAIYIGEHTDD